LEKYLHTRISNSRKKAQKAQKKSQAKTNREWTRIGNAKPREAKDESTYAKPTARQGADEHRFSQIKFTEGFDDSTELAECPELNRTGNEGNEGGFSALF
jgi:hypothetical protein